MLACGLTGGKKTTDCGEGGLVTAGRWARAESAADDPDADMRDKVRARSNITFPEEKRPWPGRVTMDRADEMEARRSWGNAEVSSVKDPTAVVGVGDEVICSCTLLAGDVESCGGAAPPVTTLIGVRAECLPRLTCPVDWPRISGWGRTSALADIEYVELGLEGRLARDDGRGPAWG